jgi:hypothetical protein
MVSSVRSQTSPKFKEGDIIAYPDWEWWFRTGSIRTRSTTPICKIDKVEKKEVYLLVYEGRRWDYKKKCWNDRWTSTTRIDYISWVGSPLERNMEVIEPLSLLVKWGIG